MPCYQMAARRLGVVIPLDVPEDELEEELEWLLNAESHAVLRERIEELLRENPEFLRRMLEEAIEAVRERKRRVRKKRELALVV